MAGERTIRIKFDGSSAGLVAASVAAKAAIKDLADDSKKRQKDLSDFGSKVGGVASKMAGFASSAANIGTALTAIPVVAASVATLAGVLPLAVAGGFAFAGAMIATKLGADGAKAAFDKLTPTMTTLKQAVSSSFESSLTPAVNNLKVVLPKLTSGFQQIVTAIGGVATKLTAMLATSAMTAKLQSILSGTAQVIQHIGAFLVPVISAFIRIGAVAMPILVQLTSGIGAVGQKFNVFVAKAAADGRLAAWIQGAVDAFKHIFTTIGQVAGLLKQVFGDLVSTGQAAGGALTGAFSLAGLALGGIPGLIVGTVIPALSAFAKTPMGQQSLKDLAAAFVKISGVVTGVLTTAFQAIAPAIAPLATAFADLVSTVGGILTPILQFLGPVLANIANFIAQNTTWITPLIIAIGLWAAAQWLLNIAMDANPIGLIIIAIGILIAIVATIITYWTPISTFFVWLFNVVKDAVTTAAQWVWQRLVDAWNFIKSVWSGVTGWFQGVWNGITNGVSGAISNIKGWFSDAWGFIKGVWSNVAGFFSGIWSGIGNGLKSALNGAIRLLNGAISGINNITSVVGIPGIPSIPYLAKGGTAKAGRSYVVGEKGPELFTPGQTGRVTSNAQSFGGAQEITLNLDLGEGIRQRMKIAIDENGRATARSVVAGIGGVR